MFKNENYKLIIQENKHKHDLFSLAIIHWLPQILSEQFKSFFKKLLLFKCFCTIIATINYVALKF